jgi:hypothetical protein
MMRLALAFCWLSFAFAQITLAAMRQAGVVAERDQTERRAAVP